MICPCLCLRARAYHWSHRVLTHHGVRAAPDATCVGGDASHGYGGAGGSYTPWVGSGSLVVIPGAFDMPQHPIPEPATWGMMLIGAVFIAAKYVRGRG